MVMFGNRRTEDLPNKAYTMWLSQFCNSNGVQLFEVNSNNEESITDTFEYLLESLSKSKSSMFGSLKHLLSPLIGAKLYLVSLLKVVVNDIADMLERLR
jgi:hypothetical protein